MRKAGNIQGLISFLQGFRLMILFYSLHIITNFRNYVLKNDIARLIFAIKEVHRLKRKTISEADHILFELIKEEYK